MLIRNATKIYTSMFVIGMILIGLSFVFVSDGVFQKQEKVSTLSALSTRVVTPSPAMTIAQSPTPSESPAGASFDGTWSSKSPDVLMTATIKNETIVISWTSGDTDALYWKGTFAVQKATGSYPLDVVSKGDTKSMETSLLASTATSKTFTIEKNQISYKVTMSGVTSKVRLKRA